MTVERQPEGLPSTLHIKISIPELSEVAPFWMRDCPTHITFQELHEACLNTPAVVRARGPLATVLASRHFWWGDRMMKREQALAALMERGPAQGGSGEIWLELRRDYYHVLPAPYLARGMEYVYLDAEAPIREAVRKILSIEEKENAGCFDLCSGTGKRFDPGKTLADYGMWPANQDRVKEIFPAHATLSLRPRTSWQSYAILGGVGIVGLLTGYYVLSALLQR